MNQKSKKIFRSLILKTNILLMLVLALCSAVSAQDRTITGSVTDEYGEILIGVSVQITGTTTGTITDASGSYSIDVPAGNESLNSATCRNGVPGGCHWRSDCDQCNDG